MRSPTIWWAAAPVLVAIGFVAGVAFVVSCGGSSGGDAQAGGGSFQGVHHVYHATVPVSFAPSGFTPTLVDTVTYTPTSTLDVPLALRVYGNVTVADNPCTLQLTLASPTVSATMGQCFLAVGASQDFVLVCPMTVFSGATVLPGSFDFQLHVSGPFALPPAPSPTSNVTFHALHVEVIALENLSVTDPSPLLQ